MRALVVATFMLLAGPAFAQAPISRDVFARDALSFEGDESVLVNLSTMPSTYYRLDALGQAVPGIRLAQWANLATRSYGDGRLRLGASFRFDLDTGATDAEVKAFPLLAPRRYALLSAWLEYDVTRSVSVRAGRQYTADVADFLAFDGARIAVALPGSLRLEMYGGVRSSLGITQGAVSSSLFELDGVASVEGAQPLAGVTLRWSNWTKRREASVGFRQSWRTSTGDRLLDAALPAGPYTTAQELVANGAGEVGPVHVAAGLGYEVVLARLMRARAAVSLPVDRYARLPGFESLVATVEWNRWQPTFALDSIWNYFSAYGYDEASLVAAAARPELRIEARLFGRLFRSQTENNGLPILVSPGLQPATGGRVGVVQGTGAFLKDLWLQWQTGFGGQRVIADGGVQRALIEGVSAHLRLSTAWWAQDLDPLQTGLSLGIVGGLSWTVPQGATVSVLLEETVNSFASPIPRVFAVVDLARWL